MNYGNQNKTNFRVSGRRIWRTWYLNHVESWRHVLQRWMRKLSLVATRLISCRVPETSYLCLTFVSECMVKCGTLSDRPWNCLLDCDRKDSCSKSSPGGHEWMIGLSWDLNLRRWNQEHTAEAEPARYFISYVVTSDLAILQKNQAVTKP